MKLATKKFFHNLLAVAVSVCMVCTMTPSAAWAAGDESDSNNSKDVVMNAWESEGGNMATGSTEVKAKVLDADFKFISISPNSNYVTKEAFASAVGKNPLEAKFPKDKLPDSYTVEWFVQERAANDAFDPNQPESSDNPKTILVGDAAKIASNSYTNTNAPVDGEGVPSFTYPGSSGATAPSALPIENGKNYEFSVVLKSQDGSQEASAQTLITLQQDYPKNIVQADGEGNEAISVWGDIYQKYDFFNPAVSVLEPTQLGTTSEAYQKIQSAAASNKGGAESVEAVTQLMLVNNAKPEGKAPYEGQLEVRLPLPESQKNPAPAEGTEYNVYMADESGNVTVKTGTVDWARSPDGDAPDYYLLDASKNKIPVVVFDVEDTGVLLGSFGIGVPVDGTYFMTTEVVGGAGEMTPSGANMPISLGEPTVFGVLVKAPSYMFSGFTLTVNDVDKTINSADLGFNQITITPNAYGIQEGDKVVLRATLSSAAIGRYEQRVSASLTCESGAGGSYTVSTVFAKGKEDDEGNLLTPKGRTLDKELVNTSTSISGVSVDRNVGLLLSFSPNESSHVKSVIINNKETPFKGTSLMLGTVGQNLNIRVTYASGPQSQEEPKSVSVQVQKRPNGKYPATLTDNDGSVVGEATYPAPGGFLTIPVEPFKDMYRLTEVLVYSPADSDDPEDIVDHVYVSPNGSDGVTYDKDLITLYNVTSDMRVELKYEMMPATIIGDQTEGGEWGWIPNEDSGATVHKTDSTTGGGARAKAMMRAAAAPRLSDQYEQGALDLSKEGAYARFVVYQRDGYELGDVLMNGNRVNNLLTERKDANDGRTYYTLIVYLGEAGSADKNIGAVPEDPDRPDNIFYTNSNSTKVSVTFNPSIITPPPLNSITTSVTSFGGGTVTPSRNVEEGGTAVIEFFPDEGYKVDNVWLDDVVMDENRSELSVDKLKLTLKNVKANHTVVVSFASGDQEGSDKARYNVTATAGVGGSITPSGTFPVYEGTTQQFVLAPSTGYQISQVYIDDSDKPLDSKSDLFVKSNVVELKNITSDRKVRVTFKRIDASPSSTYTVTAQKKGSGKVSPAGPLTVGAGGSANYSVIPEDGWYVQDIRVVYVNTGSDNGISLLSLYNKDTFSFTLSDVQEDAVVKVTFAEGQDGKVPGTDEDLPKPDEIDIIKIPSGNLDVDPDDSGTPGAIVSPSFGELEIVKEPGSDPAHGSSAVTFTVTVADGYELDSPIAGGGIVVWDGAEDISGLEGLVSPVGDGVYNVIVPKEHVTANLAIDVNTHPKQSSTEVVTLREVKLSVAGEGYITPGMTKGGPTTGTVQVASGKNQTFGFIPADGWKLHTVYLNGKPTTVSGNVLTVHAIQQDSTTIEAVFSKLTPEDPTPETPKLYNVNIEYGPNGTISPLSKTVPVVAGSSFSISTKPNEGYKAVAKVDGVEVPVIGNSVEIAKVDRNNMKVVIDFERVVEVKYRQLTVNASGPGTTSPSGMSLVRDGSEQIVSLAPDSGKRVKSVEVQTTGGPVSKYADVDRATMSLNLGEITEDTTVNVVFCGVEELKPTDPAYSDPLPPAGTVVEYVNVTTSTPDGGGLVTPASAKVAKGGSISLTFIPNNGYELESVTVAVGKNEDDRTASVANGTLELVRVAADTKVVAKFKKTQTSTLEDYYTVFVKALDGGSVSPAGAMMVAAGGSQTITIIPDPGYKVGEIRVNDVPVGSGAVGSSYTLFNVTEDKNVVVKFNRLSTGESGTNVLTHDITATSTMQGLVSPEGTTKVADGKNASFTFVPNPGFKLSYVTVDGGNIPAQYIMNNQYIFVDVKESHTLNAVFIEEDVTPQDFATVSVGNALNGTITPSDNVVVKKNDSASFTVTPFYGYTVDDILLDGKPYTDSTNVARCSYANGVFTIYSVNKDMSVSVSFRPDYNRPDPGSDTPTYVPIGGGTSSSSGAGGTTSIGDGGYIEKPGDGASDAERNPQVTITPDDKSMVDEVEITYGDGSKTVIRDDGTYEYDDAGNLLDADGDPIDSSGKKAELDEDGNPVNPVKYPGEGSPAHPTYSTPDTTDIYEQGYVKIDGDKAIETGGAWVDVTFRPLEPGKSPDDEIINGKKPADEQDPNIGVITGPTYYEINATASGGGRIYPEGRVKVAEDQSMAFQMLPSNGYELATLSVTTVDSNGKESTSDKTGEVKDSRKYVVDNISGNMSINASFGFVNNDVVRYSVTAHSNVSGGVSPEAPEAASVPKGSDAVVYLFPPEGQKVANITVTKDGDVIFKSDSYVQPMYTASNIDGNIDVSVTYEAAGPDEPTWTVTPVEVTASCPGGHGSVSPERATVPAGSPQTFFFEPEAGYVVDFVVFNGISAELKNNPSSYSVTPSAGSENNLAVYFKEVTSKDKQFTTLKPVVNGGHATVQPRSMKVEVGGTVEFYVSPDSGYTIESVKVDGWDVSFKPAVPEGTPIQNGSVYSTYLVSLDNVQPGAKVEITTKATSSRPVEIPKHSMTIAGENAVYSPMGVVELPEGAKQLITIDPLSGYYLDSVMVTERDASGNAVGDPVDMTDAVSNNQLTVEMGKYDKEVYIKYLLVGGDTKPTPVNVTIGTTKTEDGRDVNATIFMASEKDGTPIPLPVDSVTRKILGSDGKPMEFVRDKVYTFYAMAPAFDDGKQLILSKATYNGKDQMVPNLTGMVTDVKLNASGTLDLVFRELKDGEQPISRQEYNVKFEVVDGVGGSIQPDIATTTGFDVRLGSPSNPVMLIPDGDNWMIESVTEVYLDKDGNQIGEPNVIDPRRYKDETYSCTPGCDTIVQVKFTECAIVDVQWDKSLGFVAPNPTKQYLKIPVDKTGEPYAFVVAPFEDCYVDSFTVTPEGQDSTSYFEDLSQTQSVVDYLTGGGYNIVDAAHQGGVVGPNLDESGNVVKASASEASFAAQALDVRAGDFDPIDYNGFVPEKGTSMQNAYGVQTYLGPTKNTVRIGLYTTRIVGQKYTLTTKATGNGRILPDYPVTVNGGDSFAFNFIADDGYVIKNVYDNGIRVNRDQLGANGTSYLISNIDRDHTIEVEFGPITSDESSRLLRVASSLARTGDLAGPAIGCLLLVAAAGLMVTAISYIRRRNRRRQRYQQ